jgi:glycosyltransferase involved in cell wall biosynthesis
LIQTNNQIVAHRYPTYDREVQSFITADPLITPRVALAIALVAARARAAKVAVPIYLAHSLGGGAEDDLQRRVTASVAGTGGAIVLRVGGPQRWQVEVVTGTGTVSGGTDAFSFVEALLAPIGARRLIYSCGVGDPDPAALPELFLSLRKYAMRDRIEVLFHDFFPLSPSYCLLDRAGVYRGLPLVGTEDPVHSITRPDGTVVDLAGWRAGWGRLIAAAEHVTVFSEESRTLVLQVYPQAATTLRVQPHSLLAAVPEIPAPAPGARPVIGVLGNIGLQKGARLVQDMARSLQGRSDLGLVLIGNIDPAFGLPETIPVHGTYRIAELDQLVAKYGITCWLIPSVWPETFSFTTHEALASGLPVYAFYLGAQGGAVVRAENGRPINFDPDADLAQVVLATIRADHAAASDAISPEVA